MKHSFLHSLVMGAIVLCSVATAMTSCKKDDLIPSEDAWVLGKWYMEKDKHGTLGEGDAAVEYEKVVLCGEFKEGNKGFWALIYVDSTNRAVNPDHAYAYFANCTYAVKDKTVAVKLTANYLPTSQMEWTLTYDGDCLETMYDNVLVDLKRITTGQDAMFLEWMKQLGFGADMDTYNINDKDFTQENWREQPGIYIYDGKGTDITDEKGRTGYTLVALPWYKDGVVDTNLDPEFCDDITPENGWEWVLNLCGNRNIVNNNFFALYNKYSGVLRIFYYMPNNVISGNDHLWEVDMTNMMAQRCNWGYGLPMDLKITNKAVLGQEKANFFVDYITPYVRQTAPDGKITPNQGWWAFDIDLSLYRPNDNGFGDNQSISLQIRSWDEAHVSLTSAITGKLDGEMKLDQTKTRTIVSKKKGLFGFVKDAINIGKTAAAAIVSAKSGDAKGALTNGISAAKDGYAFYGALKNNKNSSTTVTDTLSRITGTFNASVQADAETDGIISASKPVTKAASPTIPGKSFITSGTGLGDGVWNLKTSPVVYYFGRHMGYKDYCITFFDPSSVEVVLNPDVFPESDIEWVEVDALAGVRTDVSDGNYRAAFGISYSLNVSKSTYLFPADVYGDDFYWWFDFFYNNDDKYGMEYVHNRQYKGSQKISGRCLNGEYYLEPCVQWGLPHPEVNVSVVVKLRSMDAPIVYSRTYLPVVKMLNIGYQSDIADFAAVYDQIVSKPKKNGKFERGPVYDYQLERLRSLRRYLDNEFEFKAVSTKGEGCYDIKNALRTNYYIEYGLEIELSKSVQEGNWNFEWSYDKPAAPWAYEITGADNDAGHTGVPVSWKLYAKLNEGDSWTLLDEQKDNKDWYGHEYFYPRSAKFDIRVKNQPWQYYRLEVTKKSTKDKLLSIKTFKLLY
ncbi:MAG: hypothetical protein J6P74_04170 [Paludibacteraceae bacterium]|nr:hypothetical protein [Paludibacteraceae bacterium]